jgi:CRP-like cAMP-binding protein
LLASLLNLSPETLSRVLHQLMDEQLIRVCGSTIHIGSPDALKTYQHSVVTLH